MGKIISYCGHERGTLLGASLCRWRLADDASFFLSGHLTECGSPSGLYMPPSEGPFFTSDMSRITPALYLSCSLSSSHKFHSVSLQSPPGQTHKDTCCHEKQKKPWVKQIKSVVNIHFQTSRTILYVMAFKIFTMLLMVVKAYLYEYFPLPLSPCDNMELWDCSSSHR